MRAFETFPSWGDVIAHVRSGLPIYYHAPLDVRPAMVLASTKGANPRKVRVDPSNGQADPFWADAGHLDRFRRVNAFAPVPPTSTSTYDVHEGRPSWHQQRAGAISAGVTTGFKTREEAQAFADKLKAHHPGMPAFVVERPNTDTEGR